ncbi:uncharacterized protein LOC119668776 [Teleopsis dalmanni]|uniref:uncharacterized protein LOC119668776 n=1 Tax=Teleopsis dalmanni TaxID=139649 RepID=UPI0018CED26F|nr:uncharacterized protein LOC119668776 [Teleopsis dalmanni]
MTNCRKYLVRKLGVTKLFYNLLLWYSTRRDVEIANSEEATPFSTIFYADILTENTVQQTTTNRSEVNTQKKTTPGRIRFENNLRRNKQTSAIQELSDIERKQEEFQNRKLQLEVEKFEFRKELELKKLRMKEDKMNMRFRLKEEKLKQKERLAIYELDLKYGKTNDS